MRGAQNARKDLLGVGTLARSIATAADLARDDRRTDRLLGTPVRGVEVGIHEEAEEGREFDHQMPGESLHVGNGARILKQVQDLIEEMPTRDVDAVRGHRPGGATVSDMQRVLQNPREPRGKPGPRMIALHEAAPSEEVPQTGLMERVGKLPVGRPPVASETPREIGAEDRRGVIKAAAAANAIDGRRRGRKHPQPIEQPADFPPGFIGHHDRARPHRLAQRRVRGLALRGGAVQGAHQRAGCNVEAKPCPENGGDLAERQAALFVETHGQRDGLRAEVHGRSPERVRDLERMSALHPAVTAATAADVDVKAPHNGLHRWQVFLVCAATCVSRTRSPQAGQVDGSGTSCVSCTTVGVGRCPRRPYARPGLRPGRRGRRFGAPFANGAACRAPARRAASSSSFNRVFSRSSRARSRSTRARSTRSRSSS